MTSVVQKAPAVYDEFHCLSLEPSGLHDSEFNAMLRLMKAVLYEKPWTMTVVDLPKPIPGEGEVLLSIRAVGICGSDIHGFTGESGRRSPDMVMGHEVGAIVS